MGAPAIIFSEAQSLTALRTALIAVVCPPRGVVKPSDVYRSRPAASAGVRGLSVTYLPTTPIPVDDGPQNDESVAAQRQRVQVVVGSPVEAISSFLVLGQLTEYVTLPGDGAAEVAAGLVAAVDALAIPGVVAVVVQVDGVPAAQVSDGNPGVDMNVQVVAGALTKVVADDNTRSASWNWSSWTIRIVVQDIVDAAGDSRCVAVAETIRRALQAESYPLVNGQAYPYLRDVLAEGNLGYQWCLGPPVVLDGLDGGVWVRRCGLDVVFRPVTGMTLDVPSIDVMGFQPPTILDP